MLKILSHILGDAPTQHSTDDNNREPITRTEVIDNMKAKARQAENHELEGLLDANLRIPAMSLLFNIDSISQKGSKTALMDAFIRVFDDARGYYGANKYVAKLERDLDNNGLSRTVQDRVRTAGQQALVQRPCTGRILRLQNRPGVHGGNRQ